MNGIEPREDFSSPVLRDLWEHHWWSFEQFLNVAFALSDEEFHRELGLSYGSVHGILAHSIGAEQVWIKRVIYGESVSSVPGREEMPDKTAIKGAWEMTKGGWRRVFQEGHLQRVIHYSNTKGQEFSDPVWRVMAHLVDHSATYRGILISALRLLGRTPPASGVITYTRAISKLGF